MLFIFHNNIIKLNVFDKITPECAGSEEWKQTEIFNNHNIPLNCIGINLINTKYNAFSGDINI